MGWAEIWRRWFRIPPPTTTNAAAQVGLATEIGEAKWRDALYATRIEAYQSGLAEGELRGRLSLANEIEARYGSDGGNHELTADDAARIRIRQVH